MSAIRAIFDGKTFVPQQPVTIPAQSEAIVLVESDDEAARQAMEQEIREYYKAGDDAEDETWGHATAPESNRAWEED